MKVLGYKKCILCRCEPPIKNSHVLPKFVFKWMIETGGTKHLRYGATPNKRVQDGLKLPLLCLKCESKTGLVENEFATKIFRPSVNNSTLPKKYTRSTYEFVASVHHRIQAHYIKNSETLCDFSSHERRSLLVSISNIRKFLSGRRYSASPQRFFLLPLGLSSAEDYSGFPPNWHRYIRRISEMDLIHTESGDLFASYFKIGPWLSFCLVKNEGQPWYGNELFPVSRKSLEKRTILPPSIHEFLHERAERSQETLSNVSDKQQAVINEAISKADFTGSGRQMFDAISEDVRVFGDGAFKKTRN